VPVSCKDQSFYLIIKGSELSDGSRNKEIDTRIDKANAILPEVYRSVATKRKLSNIAKLSMFKSVLFRSSPMVINL